MKKYTHDSAVETLAKIELNRIERRRRFWKNFKKVAGIVIEAVWAIFVIVAIAIVLIGVIGGVSGGWEVKEVKTQVKELSEYLDHTVAELHYSQGEVTKLGESNSQLRAQLDTLGIEETFLEKKVRELEKPDKSMTITNEPPAPMFTNIFHPWIATNLILFTNRCESITNSVWITPHWSTDRTFPFRTKNGQTILK